MILQDILYKVPIHSVRGNTNIDISALAIDSRKVNNNSCFIAVKGTAADGHAFIEYAIGKGAVAVVCEGLPDVSYDHITYIEVEKRAAASG